MNQGEIEGRIRLISTWREALDIFRDEEQLLLEMKKKLLFFINMALVIGFMKKKSGMGRKTHHPGDDGHHQHQFMEPNWRRIEFASRYVRG